MPPPILETVRLHLKVLVDPVTHTVDEMVGYMRQVYEAHGIGVVEASREPLSLPLLENLPVGDCTRGELTAKQLQLFANRRHAANDDVCIYFVASTVPAYSGCAVHPDGSPAAVVVKDATRWTLGHEVGHVLGLPDVNDRRRLMVRGTGRIIAPPPPTLSADEVKAMLHSKLTR